MSSLADRKLRRRAQTKDKVLPPIIPNAGIEAAYRRKLISLVEQMNKSVSYWLEATYKNNEPLIAQDELPANVLDDAVKKLTRRWQRKFNKAAKDMARHFAEEAADRVDDRLRQILDESGWTVKFKLTDEQRDILNATINENVSLIKSIPQRYLSQVEGMVARSVKTGRDLGQLSRDLQKRFKVTRDRAALIARDQNNKATSALNNARQRELGITQAIWVHSSAGKHPRPTHLKNNGKKYDVTKGWYDPAVKEYIFPGQLINCRCFCRSVIPGFS